MRVALLSHNARAGDAIGHALADKLTFFLERGADVRAFVEDARHLHPEVRPHATAWPDPAPVGESWRFLSDCDLVLAEFGQFYSLLTLLPLLAGGRPRVLVDYHGVTPPGLWSVAGREALVQGTRHRGLVWCADAVLVHSRYTHDELRRACDYPAERLHRIGFPVEAVEQVRNLPGDGGRLKTCPAKRALGIDRGRVVLFVGRLAPNKRVPLLIEALAGLGDLDPPVHLLVAGDDRDLYASEAQRCRDVAEQLGVSDRVHLLGHLTGEPLRDAYHAADVFVTASAWESFCIPVIEAMAHGVPVVAARATALPETVGGAGLTFDPDDVEDLRRQLRRVLQPQATIAGRRVAVVSFRYGTDFVGGAETSLRTLAETLHQAGCRVEVFATCTRAESAWADDLPEGTQTLNGVPVHRFRIDPHDRARHLESVEAVWRADRLTEQIEADYLRHTIHSSRLVEALVARRDDFDAVVVGPYLFGLTHDVARALPENTLLLPCFHDEPFARMKPLLNTYRGVGGVLYHSPEEQRFAEAELGFNHPGAACVGTWLAAPAGDAEAGRRAAGVGRYIVYCGRYSGQKDVPLLLDHARRYSAERPGRFTFVFLGQGEVKIPREPWARDLGFVAESLKRDVIAGAAALVQLSRYESLSLAALEAWGQGVPVIAGRVCEVLVGHLGRCGAGWAVEGYEEFAAALDDLWDNTDRWSALGRQGAEYVRRAYGTREEYAGRLLGSLDDLALPLAEKMRRRGLERAASFSRGAWREQFAAAVEQVLHGEPRPCRHEVEVTPRGVARVVPTGARGLLVPVRVVNRGTHPLLAEGPARSELRCRVVDGQGRAVGEEISSPLPGPLMPGHTLAAAVAVPAPEVPGTYQVGFWAVTPGAEPGTPAAWLRLEVGGQGGEAPDRAALDAVQAALVEAQAVRRLPDDYVDVTEGALAGLKRRIKGKLLGNFKRAYVDVLSRQQSDFNRHLLTAVQELSECCATLEHAVGMLLDRVARLEGQRKAGETRAEEPGDASGSIAVTDLTEGVLS